MMRTNMSAVTVNTIDLCALSELNDVFKYADDTTLLVPEHTDTELEVEFNRIKAWAAANCLHLTQWLRYRLDGTVEFELQYRPMYMYWFTYENP